MTEETTQAVVDPTAAVAQPTAPEGNAQGNELESFLNEYESGTKPQTPPVTQQQPAVTQPDVSTLQARLDAIERANAEKEHTADLADAVKTVRGDLDVPEWAVQGWIDAKARENKKVQDIWANRKNDPTALNRLLSSMKKEFAGIQSKRAASRVDENTSADVAAVAAAVRGASTQAPVSQPPDFGRMSNAEFNEYLRQNNLQ
jgi:hypothetical protein